MGWMRADEDGMEGGRSSSKFEKPCLESVAALISQKELHANLCLLIRTIHGSELVQLQLKPEANKNRKEKILPELQEKWFSGVYYGNCDSPLAAVDQRFLVTGMKDSHSKFSECSSLSGKEDTSLPHYDIEKIIKMRNLLNEHILLSLTEKKDGSGRNMSCD